jgi:hypothetical protein
MKAPPVQVKCTECPKIQELSGVWAHRRLKLKHPYLCRSCRHSGRRSNTWKGGRIRSTEGYIQIHSPEHPNVQGRVAKYVYEHRLVMESTLGRVLRPDEFVHHKNRIRSDNRLENLELWTVGHPTGQRVSDRHCISCTCNMQGSADLSKDPGVFQRISCVCRCGHAWAPRSQIVRPRVCPLCKTPNWDLPKREKKEAGVPK